MRGLWLKDGKLSFRRDLEAPHLTAGEALVRVRLAGICGTDLELVKGYYPFCGIPGHEFVGEIAESPGESGRVGERVVGEINISCRKCASCRAEMPRHCAQRTVLGILGQDGAFAQFLRLPMHNLIAVPASVADESAVFSEPLAAALRIAEQVDLSDANPALLIGAGRLGMLIAGVLIAHGCRLKVLTRHSLQKKLLEKWGAECVESVPTGGMRTVVEATGSAEGFELARRAVRPQGTIVLKSTYKGQTSIDFSRLVVDEVTLVGSRCGPMIEALEWLEEGRLDPRELINETYSLEQGLEAFEQAARPGVLKVLLAPGT